VVGSCVSSTNSAIPGLGAPIHSHAVEEVLEVIEVIEGTAEIWLGKESAIVKPNQSVLVPAGARHGFRNLGTQRCMCVPR
jgi:mannose-6-phosphate isomerase-like protein (cupin superfamily)